MTKNDPSDERPEATDSILEAVLNGIREGVNDLFEPTIRLVKTLGKAASRLLRSLGGS